jgi:hypothetical protein
VSWRTIAIIGYCTLGGALLVLEVVGRRLRVVPTFGDVLSFLMRSGPGRWAVLVGWWWLGWHFFVR